MDNYQFGARICGGVPQFWQRVGRKEGQRDSAGGLSNVEMTDAVRRIASSRMYRQHAHTLARCMRGETISHTQIANWTTTAAYPFGTIWPTRAYNSRVAGAIVSVTTTRTGCISHVLVTYLCEVRICAFELEQCVLD